MFNVVLFQPEIPPNTGNIIRLCSNIGAMLHLIEPLGFVMDDKRLRRAGLDYSEWVNVMQHKSLAEFYSSIRPQRMFACSARGKKFYTDISFQPGDTFLMGPEATGLPGEVLDLLPPDHVIRIPMLPQNRSLNLSNATAIVLYEAWRQFGFNGAV